MNDFGTTDINCPECGEPLPQNPSEGHGPNCLFGSVLAILIDRYTRVTGAEREVPLSPEHVLELEAEIADKFWEEVGGPAVDWMEARFREQTEADVHS